MINIVHINLHCDDNRKVTAIEMKLKSITKGDEPTLIGQALISTATAAFFKTTLLTDVGTALKMVPNPKRSNIVNMVVTLKHNSKNDLTSHDVANFLDAFQDALDTTSLRLY